MIERLDLDYFSNCRFCGFGYGICAGCQSLARYQELNDREFAEYYLGGNRSQVMAWRSLPAWAKKNDS